MIALLVMVSAAVAVPDTSFVVNCDGPLAQHFTFEGGMIRSLADGQCLDTTCLDTSKGCFPLIFSPCSPSALSLQWEHISGNRFASIAHNRSACLDLQGGGVGPEV
jgi:hypothetical protein